MPKFTVQIQQYVEKIGTIEIEADNAEHAVQQYKLDPLRHDPEDWQDGEDSYSPSAYAVINEHGDIVWERY